MTHIKPIGHFLIILGMINIVLHIVTHSELSKEKPIPTIDITTINRLAEESKSRESMIMQILLLGQHKNGLHENTVIDLCPLCQTELKITKL